MNYYNFVNTILETSKSHKLVYEVGEGDIYEHLNSGDHKYPCVFLTVQNVDSNGDQMTVTGSLFYVDALLSDTSNKLQIQSTGMTTLQQIFMRLMDNYPDFDLRTGRYTPFDEKFSDLCAGVFSNFTISFMDDICIVNDDIFEGDEPITPEPEGKYMTITILDGTEGTVIEPIVKGNISPNLQYRINNGKWNDYVFGQTSAIHSVAGDSVQLKGNNPDGVSVDYENYLNFSISGNPVALSGNVMSLIDGIGDALEIPCNYCFNNLFRDSTIKTISSDFLPATTLTESCYTAMFSGCTALVNAPVLPATTLANSCYSHMFYGCTSLVNAPELPATTLAERCYEDMLEVCTSLTTAPELPATTLTNYCYYYMFQGCTSLETAPELPATTIASNCYSRMFWGCTSLTTAPELPATTLASNCYSHMFGRCTSLTTAPELPATTLAELCYVGMFKQCALVNAPELPATTLASNCYYDMFEGCKSLTTTPELPATTLAEGCYIGMFYGCTSLTTAPELPATTLANSCYRDMFSRCTSLTTAPELPATTLVDNCYYSMFEKCYNLNYVKCLATDITAPNALNNWLSGVAPTGTFVKKYGVEFLQNSPSGIPQGWTVEEIDAPIPPEPEGKYMTMTVDSNSGETIIEPKIIGSIKIPNLQYRVNNGEWTDFVCGESNAIHVFAGDCVQIKGVNENGLSVDSENYLNIVISDLCHLSGNIMSLIDGVGAIREIPCDYCFYQMFSNSKIKTVSSDFLPATTITSGCYRCLFLSCYSLVNSPELPATELAPWCYTSMFQFCRSLENSPELPATTMKEQCYNSMFNGCYNLLTAPSSLPGTILAEYCYCSMFQGCYKLKNVPGILPATTISKGCYCSMFDGCKSIVTAPELPATTLADYCYQDMFWECTKLVNAPALPATSLAENCYQYMFTGCTSLVNAPELPAEVIYPYCYDEMFTGCTSLVNAPELPARKLELCCYRNMFRRCKNLQHVKCLATEFGYHSLEDWLLGVAPTGTFVKPTGVSYETGTSGIPDGWTIEEI